jgi:hypothetical protein
MSDTPDVSVIIVSYNTRDLTVECVRSIRERDRGCEIEIIVVDNDSSDGTVEALEEAFGNDIVLIASKANLGFAAGNNRGLEAARGRWLLLLNPDTEIHDDAITRTLRYAESKPDAGVVGVRCLNPDGSQQSTLFRDKRVFDFVINVIVPNRIMRRSRLLGRSRYTGIDLDQEQCVEVVAGCYMFVPRAAYEEVGGMDERFFMYGEESEWCHRIRSTGRSVWYCPDASILHYGGVSADRHPAEMNLAMAHSTIMLVRQTRGPVAAYVANLAMLLRDAPRALLWPVYRAIKKTADTTVGQGLRRSAGRFRFHLSGLVRPNWNPGRSV